MDEYLSKCQIDIEIYEYDPNSKDDLFEEFKAKWLMLSFDSIKMNQNSISNTLERLQK